MPGTVLIVDDEPTILNAVSTVLKSAGFDTHTCHMWPGVARSVRDHMPDIVLLDYNMPGVKGSEICRILKRNAMGGHMKVMLFSAEPESDLVRIVDECGADGYIRKNTPAPLLVDTVRHLIA